MCEALLDIRTPNFIRNDTHLKLQVGKANPDVHNELMDKILGIIKAPIKLSGNINGVRPITSCNQASRYAVNLLQAKNIIKELQQQPDELRELLNNQDT